MFETEVRVRGRLTADPTLRFTTAGVPVATMRLATSERRPDPAQPGSWLEGPASFYTVSVWRAMGHNAATSFRKGEPVFVLGRQRVVSFERKDGTTGTDVQIDAQVIGHDLLLGTSTYAKVRRDVAGVSADRLNEIPDFADPSLGDGPQADPQTAPYELTGHNGLGGGEGHSSLNGPLVAVDVPAA